MTDIIIEHAKTHVWQEPTQDHQFNIGLGRLTKRGGFIGSTEVMWHRVLSPTRFDGTKKFHHVYQVGQISDITLNILNVLETNHWIDGLTIVNDLNILIEVYFESGAVVPLSHIWLMRDFTNNLLLCVYNDPKMDYGELLLFNEYTNDTSTRIVTCDNDKLVARFYTNAIQNNLQFNSQSSVSLDSVKMVHSTITNANDYSSFISRANAIRNSFSTKGDALWYMDGFLISRPPSFHDGMVNNQLTYVWDETFKFTQMFNLRRCPVFTSEKDRNRTKYLLLCDNEYDVIDYYDDVDFYVVAKKGNAWKGVYINRAIDYAIRQVAHNAYAIDTQVVDWYVRHHTFFKDADSVSIHIKVREGGMSHGVFSQSNRIDELFRLSHAQITNAFLNTDSLIPEWRAATLENSNYVNLMGASLGDITKELVTDAYGYTGITATVANPRVNVIDGNVTVPDLLMVPDPKNGRGNRTIHCYDADGLYLGYQNNGSLSDIINVGNKFPTAVTAECFRMNTRFQNQECGIIYNMDVEDMDLETYGFRCYVCPIVNGEPNMRWEDVTDTAFCTYTPGTDTSVSKLTWDWGLLTDTNLACCVRLSKYVLINGFVMKAKAKNIGYNKMTMVSTNTYANGNLLKTTLVPPGVIEVFHNGYQLIEDIDFYIEFPYIYITNLEVLQDDNLYITTRSYANANPETGKHHKPIEVGFVNDGYLSLDGEYDISRNRVNKVVVNSVQVAKQAYKFSEYNDVGNLYPVDGRPYMVLDYIPNVNYITGKDTALLYNEMRESDIRFGKYLTQFLPEPTSLTPQIITERWQLVSPLISMYLHLIKKGQLSGINNLDTITKDNVQPWISLYEDLMLVDPAYRNEFKQYTNIRPHMHEEPMACSEKQYQFLEIVIREYLNDRIDLTNFVIIG